jgi:hypothetical protein
MVTMAGLKVDAIAVYHVQVVTFRLSKHMMGVVRGPVQVHIAHFVSCSGFSSKFGAWNP